MESLSRSFHSRKPSNTRTFSTQNPYDAVLTNRRRNYAGASTIDVQDYSEIFSSSKPSSIPVLDVSTLGQPSDALTFNFRDSNPNYSNIFGGFRDDDVAVSYEELFGRDKSRAPISQDSPDALKQFNMSYNKINPKCKDGLDRTRHVTQLPAVTGFTCFVDEPVIEAKKPNLSAVNVRSSRNAVRKESNHLESIFDDKRSRTFDIDLKNNKDDQKRSRNLESCKPDFDEKIDVNSAASALKKAIEKAQESIRIAKESVGRKKNGLQSVSNNKFHKSLKLEGEEDSSQVFQDVGRNRKYCGTVVVPNYKESEKLFVAKKFIDEISEKISESVKDSKFRDDIIASNEAVDIETSKIEVSNFVNECQTDHMFVDEDKGGVNAVKPSIDVLEDQIFVKKLESEENDTNDNENRLNASMELQENEKQEKVLEHEEVENAESEKLEEILEASERVESENESEHDNQESVLEHEDNEYAESEKHDEILEASELVESENESKHDQNSEDTDLMLDDFGEIDVKESVQICDNKLEQSEVKLHDDCESIQEDDHTGETKGESLDESYDQEVDKKSPSDDNIMEETDKIDYVHIANNILEMNDINESEFEVKSEENNTIDSLANLGLDNDARPESSSDSNIQPPHKEILGTEKSNVVKDSQEPESRHKEHEVEESGPSKVLEKARFNKIDKEATVKRREWEKNRLAVERAVREARERAFAEARERAERERAAVEKATEEVRQRMVAEAHEKVSKASVERTTSTERAKLRAERAAVERATSEARQRALEKAISEKTASDLNRTESALRTKAKLEKHNRIMERAAKALAEKEKRDRLVQKEQAERNRLAENLDTDIKRWSNGKEGNLRALLSTLQYILGPESGWQPVTLTEIITTSAVKKAYRKATLCVHPDKLQQRGSTIQHKYICEKVFDLLKAAWNRFNSEER